MTRPTHFFETYHNPRSLYLSAFRGAIVRKPMIHGLSHGFTRQSMLLMLVNMVSSHQDSSSPNRDRSSLVLNICYRLRSSGSGFHDRCHGWVNRSSLTADNCSQIQNSCSPSAVTCSEIQNSCSPSAVTCSQDRDSSSHYRDSGSLAVNSSYRWRNSSRH